MIGIYKGVGVDGNPVAFFDRTNSDVVSELLSMSDAAAQVEVTVDLKKVDSAVPVRRVAEVRVDAVDDDAFYNLVLADGAEPAAKPDTGRKPSGAPGAVVIQSLVFSKPKFTPETARAWISSHDGFGDYGMDDTESTLRFRQYDPGHFEQFRTSQLSDGVSAVFGAIKGAEAEGDSDMADAEKSAQMRIAIRELNKAIDKRGLTLLKDSTAVTKADDGTEERFVLSMVLEPNDGQDGAPLKPDTQDDIYSKRVVRDTAHGWMENFGQIDLQHNWKELGKEDVAVLESFLAPCDFKIGESTVIEGSWMLGLRVKNDTLWSAIKAGEIGAYSVGGTAVRTPADASAQEE